MKKTVLFICLLFFGKKTPIPEVNFWEEAVLDTKNSYLVFRGTDTKQGAIARDFNLADRQSSHVGLAIHDSDSWKIFHIVSTDSPISDFKVDTFDTFLSQEKERVFFASIWEICDLTEIDQIKIKAILNDYATQELRFDRSFSLKKDNKLYCSELVQNVLTKVNPDTYQFKLHKKKLTGLYASYFRKDSLSYYPVDMFQHQGFFKQIKAWNLK